MGLVYLGTNIYYVDNIVTLVTALGSKTSTLIRANLRPSIERKSRWLQIILLAEQLRLGQLVKYEHGAYLCKSFFINCCEIF